MVRQYGERAISGYCIVPPCDWYPQTEYFPLSHTILCIHSETTLYSSLLAVVITLFQLFTLDQWYNIYNDLIKVIHPFFAATYMLLWVWIGSFVFRNLFVGIMGMFVCTTVSCVHLIVIDFSCWYFPLIHIADVYVIFVLWEIAILYM